MMTPQLGLIRRSRRSPSARLQLAIGLVVLTLAACGGNTTSAARESRDLSLVPASVLNDGRQFFPKMRNLSDGQLADLVSKICEDMDDGGSATGALERQFAALQAAGLTSDEAIAFMGWQSAMATTYVCPEYESRLADAVGS